MTLSDPLSASEFMDLLQVRDVQIVQGYQQERSETAGGDTGYADRAVSKWMAQIATVPVKNADSEGLMARINSLGGGLKTALLYNFKLPYPSTDPDGAILDAHVGSPTLKTITDRLHVSFEDLPPGLVLPYGTYFGVVFDTSRYYLGQLSETATVDGFGDTGTVEIWPPLPDSIDGDDAVSFSKPVGRFTIKPGTAYPSFVTTILTAISFSAEQTYRA